MMSMELDSREKNWSIPRALFFITRNRDEIISLRPRPSLFDAAPEPKSFWIVTGAGHNTPRRNRRTRATARLRSFYESIAEKT